jgi:lipopolysaccharide transport system permease protein
MIQKIYFPRLVIPLSKAIVGLIDFLIILVLLIITMIAYGVMPSGNIVWLPVFILLTIVSSLGIGIWISALTIRYRDIQHVIPFIIQIGLYATPVAYSTVYVPEKYHLFYYAVNPMVGVVEGFRWCIIGQGSVHPYTYVSIAVVFLLFITSLIYFKKVEKVMADII